MSDVLLVWIRYFDVFRKGLVYGLVTTFTEPLLYLFAFGYGLGGMVGEVHALGREVSYRDFIFAGIVTQTMLFQGFFEGAYGGFIRMYYQRVFQAIATTPITLSEVLWAELLWDASKATFAAVAVLLLGVAIGAFSPLGAVVALPLSFFGALIFAAMGVLVAALSRNIEEISYPQYLLVFPMFLFCGVFFPVEQLPLWLQWVAWVLPLTSLVSMARTLLLGFPFQWWAVPIALVWLAVLVPVARTAMMRRLVK